MVSAADPQSAFLGPKLWEKPISFPSLDDTEFSIMNIDDFLNENNISLDEDSSSQKASTSSSPQAEENLQEKMDMISEMLDAEEEKQEEEDKKKVVEEEEEEDLRACRVTRGESKREVGRKYKLSKLPNLPKVNLVLRHKITGYSAVFCKTKSQKITHFRLKKI